jgi:hypothetical protein
MLGEIGGDQLSDCPRYKGWPTTSRQGADNAQSAFSNSALAARSHPPASTSHPRPTKETDMKFSKSTPNRQGGPRSAKTSGPGQGSWTSTVPAIEHGRKIGGEPFKNLAPLFGPIIM